ncbi:unnamed protein product, partial [Ectocarpus sp. 6 AP-2014]
PHKRERKQALVPSLSRSSCQKANKKKKNSPQYRIVFRLPTNSRRARAATQVPSNTTGWVGVWEDGAGRYERSWIKIARIAHDSPQKKKKHTRQDTFPDWSIIRTRLSI